MYSINKINQLSINHLVILTSLLPIVTQAGVVVGGTRFIYSGEQNNGISLTVQNTDPVSYLVQAKVIADNGADVTGSVPPPSTVGSPFVLTPPLFRLDPHKENSLRIFRTEGNLPGDRESLFRLSVAAIPSGRSESNSLQVAIRSTFKLFYRPQGLKGNPSHAYQEIKWSRHGSQVNASNPTPFYITLFQFSVNGVTKGAVGMIPPFSTRTQSWCPESGNCQLQWQSLNDYGGVMPAWNVTPTANAASGRPNNITH